MLCVHKNTRTLLTHVNYTDIDKSVFVGLAVVFKLVCEFDEFDEFDEI